MCMGAFKIIKKVKITNIPKTEGSIVDSLDANVDEAINAPSIRAVKEKLAQIVKNALNADAIEISNLKSFVNYLYFQIYTNNEILIKQVLGIAQNSIDLYEIKGDNTLQTTGAYYCSQVDALFMNNIRYLSEIIPLNNIYKEKIKNWISNVAYIKNNKYNEKVDTITSQTFIILANGDGTAPTLQIVANNDNSLPWLLLQLKKSLEKEV